MITDEEWKDALDKIFIRATKDPVFRALCLADPRAAVLQASGIRLDPRAKVEFWVDSINKTYSYELPPARTPGANTEDEDDALIRWATNRCTDHPTGDA